MKDKPILVTGATGYVGGRLVPALLASGYRVRAMGRSMGKLSCRPWAHHENIELSQGDVLDAASLEKASSGCRAAFYLVHSMIAAKGRFADADRTGARNMGRAAAKARLERVVYLSGLGEVADRSLSDHLKSRHEVGDILLAGSVPATVFRAAMIIGSGSASFEILRYLVERLPVMITPRWVDTAVQPIAIGNVLQYLVGSLESDAVKGETFDIGGPDILTYRELIHIFAREAGLSKRRIIGVPLLTPTLSAYWIHLVTPVPASIAIPLTEGLSTPVVCRENRIRQILPQRLISCREAIGMALDRLRQARVDSCWTDAGRLPEWSACGDADWAGGTLMECGYRILLQAPPEKVWEPIERIGGRNGWYHAALLWHLRGAIDKLAGGTGLRRGRRHPTKLRTGDALDFWRVLEVKPPARLQLMAEMKMPGEALLDFRIDPLSGNRSELVLHSRFLPRGLFGLVYWYALYPFHEWIFSGMLKGIADAVNTPVLAGPERFTPRLHTHCSIPNRRP